MSCSRCNLNRIRRLYEKEQAKKRKREGAEEAANNRQKETFNLIRYDRLYFRHHRRDS